MIVHYTAPYLLNPQHKITVNLIGLGGTGSQMLTCLARLSETLMALGHPGLHVRCFDHDIVTQSNVGRQLFSQADIGGNKAVVLVSRINRYFGYEWEAYPERYNNQITGNIYVTCVDSAAARMEIADYFKEVKLNGEPHYRPLYWLDSGNLQKTGQVILGTLSNHKQPKSDHTTVSALPDVIKKFPQIKKIKEEDQGPSCSVAQAIGRQDLFINSILAQFGANLLWKLFREGMISVHGCYVNLEQLIVSPIKIVTNKKSK